MTRAVVAQYAPTDATASRLYYRLVNCRMSCLRSKNQCPVCPASGRCDDGMFDLLEATTDSGGRCPAANCSNNVADGYEEGVDCGGSCIPCVKTFYILPMFSSFFAEYAVGTPLTIISKVPYTVVLTLIDTRAETLYSEFLLLMLAS